MARNDNLRPSQSAPAPTRQPPKQKRSRARRLLRSLFVWGFALALLAGMILGVSVFIAAQSLPSYDRLKSSQVGQMIVVRARDGSELVSLGPSYGKWLSYDEIPQVMKTAIVSVEDRRYRSHVGVDPIGVARSLMVRVESGRWRQGGSTISQQLARTVFLNNIRTFDRKIREAVLAMALEWNFSKDQILELYLNKVYFGGGAYGIDAASRKFFGHDARELSLGEAAIIAGLVKAPSRYAPTADAKAALSRAEVVLDVMRDAGAITAEQRAQVDLDDVKPAPERGQNSARYFTDWALPQLDLLLPDSDEPIEVWTTLDPGMQRSATAAVAANAPSGAQGALVSLDRDGAVLAMVGGTDYVSSNYNRATNAVRQPGSAWKLFVYLAALEAGYKPGDRVVDEPVTIQGWSPHNSGGGYAGEIDVRSAFAYSKNTVAAQLGNEVGFGAVASMARRFGITTPVNTMPSMVLGTSEVRLIDMTRAFAAISAKGAAVEPYGILRVTAANGEELYKRPPPRGEMLVPQYVAAGITDLLQSAVATGTGKAAQIGRPVAGKTGTTSSNKDGWFVGFSSGITTGVWMGRDDARAVPGLQGGAAPARAFAAFMRHAVAKRPVEQFDTELKLPDWQLEPDDEQLTGDPNEYYYAYDRGNMVRGGLDTGPGEPPPGDRDGVSYDGGPRYEDGRGYDDGRNNADGGPRYNDGRTTGEGRGATGGGDPPPAAADEFLRQAIGRDAPRRNVPPPPRPGQPGSRERPIVVD
jgi:penicillin-binding protein 1A